MKILFLAIDVSSRHGGIQRFNKRVLRCLDGLRAGGDEVRALSVRDADHDVGGVHVRGSGGSKGRTFARAAYAVARWRPDVLLLGHVLLTPVAVAARVLSPGTTSVLFAHGYEVWDDPDLLVQPEWLRRVTRAGVHRVVAVSDHTASRMREAFRLGDKPVDLLPNALDVADGPAAPARPPGQDRATTLAAWRASFDAPASGPAPAPASQLAKDPRQILTVSRLDEWGKGVDWVIRALPHVIEKIGPVRYVVAGDGRLRDDHARVAEEFGVAEHVTFAGRVSDEELDRLYRTSSAFALPSTKEGFGIVYLEAWRHALPVIAGDRDAGAEVVDDGVNGRVVNPTDARAIAGALVDLLSDVDLASRLGEAGREKLHREYSHDRFEARLHGILKNAVGQPDRADAVAPGLTPSTTGRADV